ncbi:hypothetical protein F5887DRAFT_1016169 [Amanita rubescens]|nr:hypothetical protein F5887DRAFT_1016169 [Amanita rubescens]
MGGILGLVGTQIWLEFLSHGVQVLASSGASFSAHEPVGRPDGCSLYEGSFADLLPHPLPNHHFLFASPPGHHNLNLTNLVIKPTKVRGLKTDGGSPEPSFTRYP